jgi:peptidoglycan hydrolase CwlO-like protein
MDKLLRNFQILFLSVFLVFIFAFAGVVLAQNSTPTPTPTPAPASSSGNICTSVQECADQKLDCSKCIEYLTSRKNEASGRARSLSSEIAVTNNQIRLTEARIRATEQKIKELQRDIKIAKGKVEELEVTIDRATRLLIERIAAVYQVGRIEPWQIFLTARNIDDVFTRLKYLRIVQIYDKRQVYAAEQARIDYANQKEIFEDKEGEARRLSLKLLGYNKQLESEKGGKEELLRVTRNDEARYQRLLAQARAERIVTQGGGREIFIRNVNAGDSIGTVISGRSGCSTGTHLHFSVYQGASPRDPSEYLSSKGVSYSYPESQYGYYGTINPRGNWPWPLDDPIRVTQGYGSHPFAQQFYPSGFHDGIDMIGGSLNVRAVRSGKLYEGSYGGCAFGPLTYAKIEHDDGFITWYLHIIPN